MVTIFPGRMRVASLIVSLLAIILTLFPVAHLADAQTSTGSGALTLNPGQDNLFSAVVDSVNGFAYFGTNTAPGIVVKVRLSDFTEVGSLTLKTGENYLYSAVVDSANGYAYFGTDTAPGIVVKVRLSDFSEVGSITLNTGNDSLYSAVIDPVNGFAYFGTGTGPGIVVKIRLSDFSLIGTLKLNNGENYLKSALIDSINDYVYFGTFTSPGIVVKVRLSDFTRVGSLTLNTGENQLSSALIDPSNGYAYFGSYTQPGVIVKVRLSDFTRVGALTLNTGENQLFSGVIDSTNGYGYFGTLTGPGLVVKIRLSDFTRVGTVKVSNGAYGLTSAIIDPSNSYAYFGTETTPGTLVKVPMFDYSLLNSGDISVHQGASGSTLVTATLTSGTAPALDLSCVASTLPTGASCSFTPPSIAPSSGGATSELIVHTTSLTPAGSFQVQVTSGPSGFTTMPTTLTLTISAFSVLSVECGHDLSCVVQSNATLSSIRFAGVTVHVEATGPSGLHGYANVTVPKTAIPDINQLHVSVDNSKLSSSSVVLSSNSTYYFVYFTFTFHSPVTIDIQLSVVQNSSNLILGVDPTIFYAVSGAVVAVLAAVGMAAYRFSRHRSRNVLQLRDEA